MAKQQVAQKPKAKQAEQAGTVEVRTLPEQVDRFGELEGQAEEIQAKIQATNKGLTDELNGIRDDQAAIRQDIIARACPELKQADEHTIRGRRFECRIGKVRGERSITKPVDAFVRLTGAKVGKAKGTDMVVLTLEQLTRFLDASPITLGTVDKYLAGVERDAVVTEAFSAKGDASRSFKVESRT